MSIDATKRPSGLSLVKCLLVGVGALWLGEQLAIDNPLFAAFPGPELVEQVGLHSKWAPAWLGWFASLVPDLAALVKDRFGGRPKEWLQKLGSFGRRAVERAEAHLPASVAAELHLSTPASSSPEAAAPAAEADRPAPASR